jgi:hypothetical protein
VNNLEIQEGWKMAAVIQSCEALFLILF